MRTHFKTDWQRPLAKSLLILALSPLLWSQFAVGQTYTTTLPRGAKEPEHVPFNTVPGPKPTHRFWAAKNWFPADLTTSGRPYTMFPEPLAVQPTANGLLVGYSPRLIVQPAFFLHPAEMDFNFGAEGLHAAKVPVSGYSDWTVDLNFGPITTTVGRGMPFVYAVTDGTDPVITFRSPVMVFKSAGNTLGVSIGPNSYGLFCPSNGSWSQNGMAFTCHLPKGRHYVSAALLPEPSALEVYSRFAFSFPTNTEASWSYDEQNSRVSTMYKVSTRAMEGTETGFLQALYPHQYASLASSTGLMAYTYTSARGPLKVYGGSTFFTLDIFHGILPFLPITTDPSEQQALKRLIGDLREEKEPFPATDTYGLGKELARVAQVLPLAEVSGDGQTAAVLKARLEGKFSKWFTGAHTTPPAFFYDRRWGTIIGYPASYGSDEQLNDHHFHYGYWIEAAALLGMYDPAWLQSAQGGGGISVLARDIATPTRNDPMFPFLRHFDVYAGHSWASGQAPFGDGNNEESSSEAVNAWAGLILFAAETGDLRLRDAAIWMYTLETDAALDYWFNDGPVKTFPPDFPRVQIANLFEGKADAATWFGNAPAMEHGIEFLPFTGASLYLGRDLSYCRRNLAEVTGARDKIQVDSQDWPDLMEMYRGLYDPTKAISEWLRNNFVFDGESRAHEYAWLTSLQILGTVEGAVTANTPFYAVFRSNSGARRHVAFNLSMERTRVTFSDGVTLMLPARTFALDQRIFPVIH